MFLPYRVESENECEPVATYALLVLNALVFAASRALPGRDIYLLLHRFGFVPEEGWGIGIFTYMFLHVNWPHFIGNMYFLWLFGRAIEDSLGRLRFLLFYLLAGFVSVLIHAAFVSPDIADVPCVGASGAISGLLGGFAALHPSVYVECVLMLGFRPMAVVRVRSLFVLGFWFVVQILMQWLFSDPHGGSSVAYGAHIGGFMFGWAVIGVARTIRAARADRRELMRQARLRAIASRINAGETLADREASDPDVAKMLFLKHEKALPDPAVLTDWVMGLHPDEGAGITASVVLRAHMAGLEESLDGPVSAKGADAMARLGHVSAALGCLLDRLDSADGLPAQYILCEIGTILWKDMGDRERAARFLRKAVDVDAASPAADKAGRVLERMAEKRDDAGGGPPAEPAA